MFAEYIPDGYSCILQPCDMSIMKSFKFGIIKEYITCALTKYPHFNSRAKIPVKTCRNVVNYLFKFWNGIPYVCIEKTFDYIGLAHSVVSLPPTS